MRVQRRQAHVYHPGRLVIGIDPDLIKSGVALAKDGELLELQAMAFPQLLESARRWIADKALFVVEDVEHHATTYRRSGTNASQHARIAQNVGQVKATARILVECLRHLGAEVQQVKPLAGKRQAKKDANYFAQLTGWQGRTNEDKRDAGMLALYGVRP